MADYTPIYTGGQLPYTSTASATIVGGQFVEVSGTGTVGPAAADSDSVVGVAAHGAAANARVTVHPLVGVIHEFIAGVGGITAGDAVKVGVAAGEVLPLDIGAFGLRVGLALTTAAAAAKVQVLGR